jgi:hypothetical protein
MKRTCTGLVMTIVLAIVAAIGGWAAIGPARAAPPTVTPSPGYDARLQEQRSGPGPASYEPAIRDPRPVPRRHVKRIHHGAN